MVLMDSLGVHHHPHNIINLCHPSCGDTRHSSSSPWHPLSFVIHATSLVIHGASLGVHRQHLTSVFICTVSFIVHATVLGVYCCPPWCLPPSPWHHSILSGVPTVSLHVFHCPMVSIIIPVHHSTSPVVPQVALVVHHCPRSGSCHPSCRPPRVTTLAACHHPHMRHSSSTNHPHDVTLHPQEAARNGTRRSPSYLRQHASSLSIYRRPRGCTWRHSVTHS